jgi:hypothetical protein
MSQSSSVRLGITLVVIAACAAIYYYAIAKPQFQQQQQMAYQSQAEMCAGQAAAFIENRGLSGGLSTYQNHFNTKVNKCFILVRDNTVSVEERSEYLFDALERKQYGDYLADYTNGEHVTTCWVQDEQCSAYVEFQKLVASYISD